MEELTDARLRCEQLKRYVQDAVRLIEQSPHRDHFFEVAGHLIHGIPEALFKLDKALGATALAATKLDYDEIKQTLKPEKVEELERALEDSRIRYVNRRSGEPQMAPQMTPKATVQAIRAMAAEFTQTGRFPIKAAAELAASLREEPAPTVRLASIPTSMNPTMLTALADVIESGTLRNRERLAVMLDTALTQAVGGQKMQALLQSAGSREEVMDGFKKENPALTPEQLKEIADQWEANKDVVKDKSAANSNYDALRDWVEPFFKGYLNGRKAILGIQASIKEELGAGMEMASPENLKDLNKFMDAYIAFHESYDHLMRRLPIRYASGEGVMDDKSEPFQAVAGAGEEFQKVNPAITDEQVAKIDAMHDKHKDVVKNKHLAGNLTDAFGDASIALSEAFRQAEQDLEAKSATFWKNWKVIEKAQGGGVKNETKTIIGESLDVQSAMRKVLKRLNNLRTMAWIDVRTAAESDHESKFEEGKPADPTENMTPEQKAEWERQNKEHKDEFKAASTNLPDWPTPQGVPPEEWAHALQIYVAVTEFLKPAWNAGTANPDRREVPIMDTNIFVDWLRNMREQGAPAIEYVAQTIRIETLLNDLLKKLDVEYMKRRDDILQYIDTRGVAGKDAFRDLLFGQDTYGDVLRRMRHDGLITLDPAIQGYVRV
ncbi:MAG: hypothetical protein WC322_03060 [Candidatus Paceibacterota bacterium]|jgi:hypothetical protein